MIMIVKPLLLPMMMMVMMMMMHWMRMTT